MHDVIGWFAAQDGRTQLVLSLLSIGISQLAWIGLVVAALRVWRWLFWRREEVASRVAPTLAHPGSAE